MKSHTEYLTPRSLFGEPGSSRSEELAQRRLEDAEVHREIEDREATPDVVSLLMERTRQALEKLQLRIAAGKLKQPEKIGAAAERLLQRSHGYRYDSWEIHQGGLAVLRERGRPGEREGDRG
jgi:hypothetical protein